MKKLLVMVMALCMLVPFASLAQAQAAPVIAPVPMTEAELAQVEGEIIFTTIAIITGKVILKKTMANVAAGKAGQSGSWVLGQTVRSTQKLENVGRLADGAQCLWSRWRR